MTMEPWLLVTTAQLKDGWFEYRVPGPGAEPEMRRRDFQIIERCADGTVKVRNPALQYQETVNLAPRRGDIRYSCPVCGWSTTLTPQGDREWTHDGAIEPRCRKDRITLDREVVL